jgi:hypothetical protein
LSAMTCGGAQEGRKGRSMKSSDAAGYFLGTVTKAHNRGEEDPQDRARAACSHPGTWSVPLGLSSITTNPKGATCSDCQSTDEH